MIRKRFLVIGIVILLASLTISIFSHILSYISPDGDNFDADAQLKYARQGYAESQYRMGTYYEQGRKVRQDRNEAIRWYTAAAKQGHRWAQYELGKLGINSDRTSDRAEAANWLRKAAEQDNPHAQFSLGKLYLTGTAVTADKAEAAKWFRKAAMQGLEQHMLPNPAGLYLGIMYREGHGWPKDDIKAAKWFRIAAKQGIAGAQYHLGNAYFYGEGLFQDTSVAAEWFRKAADGHNTAAAIKLGEMYVTGQGVAQDHSLALMWYDIAIRSGRRDVQPSRRELAMQMTGDQIVISRRMVGLWVADHCASGICCSDDLSGPVDPSDGDEHVFRACARYNW